MAEAGKLKVGELLVQDGLVTEDQVQEALLDQQQSGRRVGEILVGFGYLEEADLLRTLSKQLQIPYVDLRHHKFDQALVGRITEANARRMKALVLGEEGGMLKVGMADPTNIFAIDELMRALGQPFQQVFVRPGDLLDATERVYRKTSQISTIADELGAEMEEEAFEVERLGELGEDPDALVVKLVNFIFEDAMQLRASDIHIEPDEEVVRVRNRVDGILQEHVLKEKRVSQALVLRLKLMAGLNISERRLPQDGRCQVMVKGHPLDVRLSTMPTQHGESIVMRLLDQTEGMVDLNHVGMPDEILERFRAAIRRPHGLILVTGPTGSGKTTTLYSALQELNRPDEKIVTVEDPVEYRLPRVQQVQVNPKIGLTFATVLRATLRQDPDIILVGEIRDQETAEIALRASITGHLVLSTLHTNEAISSAMRLVDMGAQAYLAASSLHSVVAQRLIRRVCDSCAEPHRLLPQEHAWLAKVLREREIPKIKFRSGAGCTRCNNTGYLGRIGIFEYLEMDDVMSDALSNHDTAAFKKAALKSKWYRPLAVCALDYARKGITTVSEVMRVAEQVEEEVVKETDLASEAPEDLKIEGGDA